MSDRLTAESELLCELHQIAHDYIKTSTKTAKIVDENLEFIGKHASYIGTDRHGWPEYDYMFADDRLSPFYREAMKALCIKHTDSEHLFGLLLCGLLGYQNGHYFTIHLDTIFEMMLLEAVKRGWDKTKPRRLRYLAHEAKEYGIDVEKILPKDFAFRPKKKRKKPGQ